MSLIFVYLFIYFFASSYNENQFVKLFRAIMVVNKCMCMLDDRVYHSSSRGQYCFPTVGGPREQKFFLESQFIPIDGYV